jgi:hypothetical protein
VKADSGSRRRLHGVHCALPDVESGKLGTVLHAFAIEGAYASFRLT